MEDLKKLDLFGDISGSFYNFSYMLYLVVGEGYLSIADFSLYPPVFFNFFVFGMFSRLFGLSCTEFFDDETIYLFLKPDC